METDRNRIEPNQREHRAEPRIVVNVPVEIVTIYHKGCPIKERTHIEDVSGSGCRFTMKGAVRKGDTVAIHLLAQDGNKLLDQPAKVFEIMWIVRAASGVVAGARIIEGGKFDAVNLPDQSGNPELHTK
jgi:PilZ domain